MTHTTSTRAPRNSTAADPHGVLTPLWVVVGLSMGPAVALGLARFAYALLLPSMRADLGWSYADAGTMNTANAAGYLLGALLAAPFGQRFGTKALFATSMLLTTLAIGASGLTADYSALLALRFVAGFTGALVFVCGAALTSAAAHGGSRNRAPTLLGLYFAGAGIGITASALAVPSLLQSIGWRGGWLVVGALALGATVLGCLALLRAPEPSYASGSTARGGWSPRFMACKLLAYGLFGVGYVAYATFIIAFLRTDEGVLSRGHHRLLVFTGAGIRGRRIRMGPDPRPAQEWLGNGKYARWCDDWSCGPFIVERTAGRLFVCHPVWRFFPGCSGLRHIVRPSRSQAACLDGCDCGTDHRLRTGSVPWSSVERCAVRWGRRRAGWPLAVRWHPGGCHCRRGVPTRTIATVLRLSCLDARAADRKRQSSSMRAPFLPFKILRR